MTRILLLDPGWPQSAYLIRELRREGFDLIRATPGALDRFGIGRYCQQISAPADFTDEFVARVVQEVPADIVIPLTEEIMMKLWANPPAATVNVFPRTTERQRTLLMDRRAMYAYATSVGVPVPEMREIATAAHLVTVGEELGYPFVLRGTQGIGGVQVKIVHDLAAATAAFEALCRMSPEPPFAQRMIHGRRCLIGGLFDGGTMLQWFSQMTVEAISPPTGPSIRVRSIESAVLTEYARRLFAGFGWDGLACAEFMQDAEGAFHFMEINPRPWAAIHAAHVCGLPLLRSYAQFLRDRSLPARTSTFEVGRDVTLFPQYLTRMAFAPRFGGLQALPRLLSSLTHAPWASPGLMIHFARQLWWLRR